MQKGPDVGLTGGGSGHVFSPKGRRLPVLPENWADLGSGFVGLMVLIVPGDRHSFIIYSFTQWVGFGLSLGARFWQ